MNVKQEPDMVKIRSDLREIAQLIGPGSSYNIFVEQESRTIAIELPLSVVLAALPPEMLKGVAVDEQNVSINVPDLFSQIESHQIHVRIGELLQDLPVQYVHYLTDEERCQLIELPFDAVLDAVTESMACEA